MRLLVAHCHLGLGKLYQRTSQRDPGEANEGTHMRLFRADSELRAQLAPPLPLRLYATATDLTSGDARVRHVDLGS